MVEVNPSGAVLDAMAERIAHRGPDGSGSTILDGRVGLAHRRLAIIDLSAAGAQPMRSPAGIEIVYNGEIYNYLELRSELASLGFSFRTESDTEVLLAAYERWGTDCLVRLNGMFAFALYDPRNRLLFAARDRFGEKPFYYHSAPGLFVFASEIKALLAHPSVPCQPDYRSIFRFLRYKETDRDPDTFFDGIRALPAAHSMTVRVDGGEVAIRRYWELAGEPEETGSHAALVEAYRELLADSIRLRLRSDVPVGSSLSGGLDSSAVVGYIARAQGIEHQHTFSARFPGYPLDEGGFIADVVAFSGANGHEVVPQPDFAALERLAWHQEQPLLSLSPLAQWSVMELARDRNVTVLLDGQGADETVAGYHAYFGALYRGLFRTGHWVQLASAAGAYARQNGLRRLIGLAYYTLPTGVARAGRALRRSSAVPPEFEAAYGTTGNPPPRVFRDDVSQALYATVTSTMLPTLLRYADRNSMAFSREVRLPYLDHRLVELAFRLPTSLKLDGVETKVVLREAMREYLPDSVRRRRDKIGYAPPQRAWLLGPLRDASRELLADPRTVQRPWVDAKHLRSSWDQFTHGEPSAEGAVVLALTLELWSRKFLDQSQTVGRPANS